MALTFAPATRKKLRARIALEGPSGSGKSYTSLMTGFALTSGENRVAVIDTERGSASKYVGINGWQFDVLELGTFAPKTLVDALGSAAAAGYQCVIVDSLSHFWMGTDGMLEQVDKAGKRSGGNSFAGWKEARPLERAMIDALLSYPGHVIVTMRTKTEWVVEENERGKKSPKKVGTKPEQRDGIEYEFDVVGDMNPENELVVTKSRVSGLAKAVIREPDEEFGKQILKWLEDGDGALANPLAIRDQALRVDATLDHIKALVEEAKSGRVFGAAVIDDTGDTVALEDLLRRRWREIEQASKARAAQVEQVEAA